MNVFKDILWGVVLTVIGFKVAAVIHDEVEGKKWDKEYSKNLKKYEDWA